MSIVEILLGVAFPILIGVGVALALGNSSSKEFSFARACFIIASIDLAGLIVYWLYMNFTAWNFVLAEITEAVLLLSTGGLMIWVDTRERLKSSIDNNAQASQGAGGKGGDATVIGTGTAIGGPGGRGGKYGRGGDGGNARVEGDGLAAGGAGGSVDSDDLWSPPAPSGYEVAMKTKGMPIDPMMRQFGRGGMSPGYKSRYEIVEEIRKEYFKLHNTKYVSAEYDVNAVPLDYVNQVLAEKCVSWRARVDGLDYEFYVPRQK